MTTQKKKSDKVLKRLKEASRAPKYPEITVNLGFCLEIWDKVLSKSNR